MACVTNAKVTILCGLWDGLTYQRKAEIAKPTRFKAIICFTSTMLWGAISTKEH